MKTRFIELLAVAVVVSATAGCNFVNSLTRSDASEDVVASVGSRKLLRPQLEKYVPAGLPAEDSVSLAQQYINSWTKDQLFLKLADEQLTASEKDVDKELSDYRNSLLRYRYEQKYINERLDTNITSEEISDYHKKHSQQFVTPQPLVRARVLDIMTKHPNRERIVKLMQSSDPADNVLADSLAYSSAIRYADRSEAWTNFVEVCRLAGVDYAEGLSVLKQSSSLLKFSAKSQPDVKYIYVLEKVEAGAVAPVEYCEAQIREMILSSRKHELLSGLEQELLEDARTKQIVKIY